MDGFLFAYSQKCLAQILLLNTEYLTPNFVKNLLMNTISSVNSNAFVLQSRAQEPAKVQVLFQDILEKVGELGKNDKADNANNKTAVERFKGLMDMSIGERYFELYLKQEGLTQEEFEVLPSEEQEKIVKNFQEEMDKKISEEITSMMLL